MKITVSLSFSKSFVSKLFSVHTETQSRRFQTYFSGLKSVFEKFPFRAGLVWTKGLTEEINLHFQIPLG